MKASDIIKLLEQRHSKDLFVPECKDGPTGSHGMHVRLDAWVMPKSWANPALLGYEVKITRGDFLRDEKWRRYLDACNQFYFVCPWKLIVPEEVPEVAGLIWVNQKGTKLYTKRKAPHREIVFPEALIRYVLMRCELRDDFESKEHYWRRWLEQRAASKRLGYEVRGKIRRLYEVNVERVEAENTAAHGIRLDGWSRKRQLEALLALVPPEILTELRRAQTALGKLETHLQPSTSEEDAA